MSIYNEALFSHLTNNLVLDINQHNKGIMDLYHSTNLVELNSLIHIAPLLVADISPYTNHHATLIIDYHFKCYVTELHYNAVMLSIFHSMGLSYTLLESQLLTKEKLNTDYIPFSFLTESMLKIPNLNFYNSHWLNLKYAKRISCQPRRGLTIEYHSPFFKNIIIKLKGQIKHYTKQFSLINTLIQLWREALYTEHIVHPITKEALDMETLLPYFHIDGYPELTGHSFNHFSLQEARRLIHLNSAYASSNGLSHRLQSLLSLQLKKETICSKNWQTNAIPRLKKYILPYQSCFYD